MSFHDRPCAAHGLTSYRFRTQFGCVMIGATDHEDAMRQARRSTQHDGTLEVWSGGKYVEARLDA